MPAARHASRGDEKRGDQAAVSPLLLIVVETGKRGDLDPGLAHGSARCSSGFICGSGAGGRVSCVAP
jgi:hypothetical protein